MVICVNGQLQCATCCMVKAATASSMICFHLYNMHSGIVFVCSSHVLVALGVGYTIPLNFVFKNLRKQ